MFPKGGAAEQAAEIYALLAVVFGQMFIPNISLLI